MPKNITAVIIEDEIAAQKYLQNLLEKKGIVAGMIKIYNFNFERGHII